MGSADPRARKYGDQYSLRHVLLCQGVARRRACGRAKLHHVRNGERWLILLGHAVDPILDLGRHRGPELLRVRGTSVRPKLWPVRSVALLATWQAKQFVTINDPGRAPQAPEPRKSLSHIRSLKIKLAEKLSMPQLRCEERTVLSISHAAGLSLSQDA